MVISLDSSGVQKLWIIHLMMDRMVSGYWQLYLSVIYTTLSRPELVIFTYEMRINKFTEKLKLLISFLKSWAKEESEPRTGWVKNTQRTWSRSDPTDGPGFLGLVSTYGSTDRVDVSPRVVVYLTPSRSRLLWSKATWKQMRGNNGQQTTGLYTSWEEDLSLHCLHCDWEKTFLSSGPAEHICFRLLSPCPLKRDPTSGPTQLL